MGQVELGSAATTRSRLLPDLRAALAVVALACMSCPTAQAAAAPVERAYDIRGLEPAPDPNAQLMPRAPLTLGEALARVVAHVLAAGPQKDPLPPGDGQRFSVEHCDGRLLVAASAQQQEQVQKLLDSFDKGKRTQIHIGIRFLQVDDAELKAMRGRVQFGPLEPPAKDGGKSDKAPAYALLVEQETQRLLTIILKERKGTLHIARRMTMFNTRHAQVDDNRGYVPAITRDDEPEIGGDLCDLRPFALPDGSIVILMSIPWRRVGADRVPVVGTTEGIFTLSDGKSALLTDFLGLPGYAKEPNRSWIILFSAVIVPDIFEE